MKERPILFNGAMVRAILDGRKTQTRRVMKIQPPDDRYKLCTCISTTGSKRDEGRHHWGLVEGYSMLDGAQPYFSAPGYAGDRLWVREAWRIGAWDEGLQSVAVDYIADGLARDEWIQVPNIDKAPPLKSIFKARTTFERLQDQSIYDARKAGLKPDEDGRFRWEKTESPCRIRPSIHMPRWASRILLEIVSVRVERLNDISEEEAAAEGVESLRNEGEFWRDYSNPEGKDVVSLTAGTSLASFESLWESINGPGSWDANPWVWVIEFKVVKP